MTRYVCEKGCRSTTDPKRAAWHNKKSECPYEVSTKAEAAQPTPPAPQPQERSATPPKAAPTPSGGTTRTTFTDRPAEVVKGGSLLQKKGDLPDYIIDQEHTKVGLGMFYKALYYVTVGVDWIFKIKKHMPLAQFAIKPFDLMTIQNDPRNPFARAGTAACKALGADTIEKAHGMIDTAYFVSTFGGLFFAIAYHYKSELANSPRWKEWSAKRALKKSVAEAKARGTVVETTGKALSETKVPIVAAA